MFEPSENGKIILSVLRKYVLGIPQVRILVFPTMLCVILSRYFEMKVSEVVQKVTRFLIGGSQYSRESLLLSYFTASVVSCLLLELNGFIFTGSVQRAYRVASRDALCRFISLEYSKFHNLGSGEIQNSINRKSKAVADIISLLVINFIPTVVSAIFINFKVLLSLGLSCSIIVNVSLILYTFITIKMALWRNRIREEMNRAVDESANKLHDSLTNYDTVVAFNNEILEVERCDDSMKKVELRSTKLWRTFYLLNFLQGLVFALQTGGVMLCGLYNFEALRMKPDTLMLYFTISKILTSNLDKLGYMYSRFSTALMNARLTKVPPESEPSHGKWTPPITRFSDKIVFENVSLYKNDVMIFENVNLNIFRGDKIAIIGKNGAGKSTLMKILIRCCNYDGSITIDGEEIKMQPSWAVRDIFGYVHQDTPLFNDTVKYNIKYGRCNTPDYFIINVAKRIGVHDSIMKLRDRYETVVGEHGKLLSGGEKQKVAIMRAMIKDPDILLLDEPTSALDKEAESNIMRNILSMYSSRTVIAVVHNFAMLGMFDRILCVTNGFVKEISRPEDLFNEEDAIIW